eukprot:5542434-Prymnesium_polylepis.2
MHACRRDAGGERGTRNTQATSWPQEVRGGGRATVWRALWRRASVLSSVLKEWRSSAGMNTNASVALNMWPWVGAARGTRRWGARRQPGASAVEKVLAAVHAAAGERVGRRVRDGAACLEREDDAVGPFAQPERRLEDEIDPHHQAAAAREDGGGSRHTQVGFRGRGGGAAARQASIRGVSERAATTVSA